jgi:hypothetical protein
LALVVLALILLALAVPACGGRPAIWSQPVEKPRAIGLARSVALLDLQAQRVVALSAAPGGALSLRRTPAGRGVVAAAAAPDGQKLYVLTAGHRAGLGDPIADERPRLTAIDDGPMAPVEIELGLTDPLDGLVLDPTGRWAVVYAAATSSQALVTNPNELVIVDLTAGTARHHTVHSFGGRPEHLLFTPPLSLPNGSSQLLIVQSQQDLALLPLGGDPASDDEITVRFTDGTTIAHAAPAALVVDDGDVANTGDARIGIRFQSDPNVMVLQLAPAPGSAGGFLPSVNVADVGGVPSDIAFVRTDGGLRLAALVPSASRAVLVDPVTTIATNVALPAPYQRLALVTADAGGGGSVGANADVALLWQGGAAGGGVAFWELGQAAGRPFRSIETVALGAEITTVLGVPLAGAALEVLASANGQTFYVLDLAARTAAPLLTSTPRTTLMVSPTGARVWTFSPGGTMVAATDVVSKQVRTLRADSPIDELFEIAITGGDGSGAGARRALIALHESGAVGATVYDVDAPDDSTRRIYGALLEEGPYANP